jgi:hypothetical protein
MSKKPVAVSLRKPPKPANLDEFVAGDAASAIPAPPRVSAAEQSTILHREREYREMTVYLPTNVARDLSLFCMDRNCDVNRVVSDALSKHLTATPGSLDATVIRKYDAGIWLKRSQERLRGLWALRPFRSIA